MKAAYITKTGTSDVIQFGDVPVPELGPTDVLVKVKAVAVNPIDTYIRGGVIKAELPNPYIIGCDLAGVVEKCGPQTSLLNAGDRVWCSNQGLFGREGTFAEYAAVDEKWLYPIPAGQDEKEAVAGALVGITAHLGLFLQAGLKGGEVVFVNGGTGGVGSSVVQLAKSVGAHVIATVGSDQKKAICQSLGAGLALNYNSSTLDEDIRKFAERSGGVNVWFETQRQPTFDRTVGLMSKRGRIVLMAGRDARPEFPVGPFYVNDLKLLGFAMFNATPDEQRIAATTINILTDNGGWKPPIGKVFPLERAAEAHQLQEDNTLHKSGTLDGKIVLEV